jgi:hypothetical protein
MARLVPTVQLVATKQRLGEVVFLEFQDSDIVTAHRRLGEEVRWQVHRILSKKLDKLTYEQLVEQIGLIRRCKSALAEKSISPRIDGRIRSALTEYLTCLSAWSDGVQLSSFQHQRLRGLVVENEPVSPEDLVLLLQNDNSGCQTGVYREQDGSVVLWHTEEDVEEEFGSRFDKLRVVSFSVGENAGVTRVNAFVYPDLLPGPAYCWRSDNYVQAVDAIFLKQNPCNGSMLANVATWMTLRLGKEVEPREVIGALGPFIDGYGVTVVQAEDERVLASKIEFAGDQTLTSLLDDATGSFLFQVNVFSNKDALIATAYEDMDWKARRSYEERTTRTERAIGRVRTSNDVVPCIFKLLSSRLGGDDAYANVHVKSYFLNEISSKGMRIRIGAGPALIGDQPKVIDLVC